MGASGLVPSKVSPSPLVQQTGAEVTLDDGLGCCTVNVVLRGVLAVEDPVKRELCVVSAILFHQQVCGQRSV